MRIVDIREATVPVSAPMRNAYISFQDMSVTVAAVVSDVVRAGEPVVGFGFSSNGRYGVGALLRDRFARRLLAADPAAWQDGSGANVDPERAWPLMLTDEKPGGHGERAVAVGVLDMALWDLAAKVAEVPLYRMLADRYRGGAADPRVSVYAAGGYYAPGKDPATLQRELAGYLGRGYSAVKIKIGGAPLDEDLRRIDAALRVVGSAGALAVDANARFDLGTARAYAQALAGYGLRWYEEPGDPLDYQLHAALGAEYQPPIATGENLLSAADARNLLRYGGLRPDRDILQFDCALSYGLPEYLRILAAAEAAGWSRRSFVPHGGHQLALHAAAGLGLGGCESYPDLFPPFTGFTDGTVIADGQATLPEVPGLGVEARQALIALLRQELID